MARKLAPVMRSSLSAALTSRSAVRLAPARSMSNRHLASLFRLTRENEPCSKCNEKLQRKAGSPAEPQTVPAIVHEVLSSSGQPLEAGARAEMENRFGGADFSGVRVHTGAKAAESAAAVNARAYTVGQDVVIGAGEVARFSSLMAHELAHTLQANPSIQQNISVNISRKASGLHRTSLDNCESNEAQVIQAHNEAKQLITKSISLLENYAETQSNIAAALQKHFKSSSNWVAAIICQEFKKIALLADNAQYVCHPNESNGNAIATTLWCIPFTDIRLWKLWFEVSSKEKAVTLIHEWMHKYLCKLDLGYAWEKDYPDAGVIRSSMNADTYAMLCNDLAN